uniref:Uncharacterized protein n=1 Tax=Cannabis sativa TaxID=3483 RepID=A0A803PU02_CANSA
MACFRDSAATSSALESTMANFVGIDDNNRLKTHRQSRKAQTQEGWAWFSLLVHFNQRCLLSKPGDLKATKLYKVRILSRRYYPRLSFLKRLHGHSPPSAYVAFVGKELLRKGLISKIGNGQNTCTTTDHWIPGFRQVTPLSPVPDRVASFITSTLSWDTAKIQSCYPAHVAQTILSIPLPLTPT